MLNLMCIFRVTSLETCDTDLDGQSWGTVICKFQVGCWNWDDPNCTIRNTAPWFAEIILIIEPAQNFINFVWLIPSDWSHFTSFYPKHPSFLSRQGHVSIDVTLGLALFAPSTWHARPRGGESRAATVGARKIRGRILAHEKTWLVNSWKVIWWFQNVSNMAVIFHFIYGMSSFPLTNSYFFKMVIAPPTSNIINHDQIRKQESHRQSEFLERCTSWV